MDYRLQVRIKNNNILDCIEDLGYESTSKFCRDHGLNVQEVSGLVTMRLPAKRNDGQWTPGAIRLAGAIKVLPDELFTDRQAEGLKVRETSRNVSEQEVLALANCENEAALITDSAFLIDEIEELRLAISGLSEREQLIVRLRYGMETGAEETYRGIGERLGISFERVRQILAKAERKIRWRMRQANKWRGIQGANVAGILRGKKTTINSKEA